MFFTPFARLAALSVHSTTESGILQICLVTETAEVAVANLSSGVTTFLFLGHILLLI